MLALVTVRNEGSGSGTHTALFINASERVLFDPYGGWTDPFVPERNDVPTASRRRRRIAT